MDKNIKNFWIFFTATIFSIMGLDLYIFTNGWYLIELGAPRPSIAVAWAIFFLPGTFLIFFSKKLMVLGRLKKSILTLEILKALTIICAVFLFRMYPRYESVYIISGVLGIFFVPFYPLTYTFLKEIFKTNTVVRFSNLSEVSLQISGAIALFSSGFIYKILGFDGIVVIAASCLTISSILMCFIIEPGAQEAAQNGVGENTIAATQKMSPLKLTFGFFHLVPQVILLLLNIPTLIYVEKVMQGGPIEYGILDATTALAATGVSFAWAYYSSISSKVITFVVMGVVAAIMLIVLGTFYTNALYFPYVAFGILGMFLVSFKMMSRSQLMLTHTANEVAKYSLYYQLVANLSLVGGAFWMASILNNDNGQKCFIILAALALIYAVLITPVLKKLRSEKTHAV